MKRMKWVVFTGLGLIVLGAFLKTRHRNSSSPLPPTTPQPQQLPPPLPASVVTQVQIHGITGVVRKKQRREKATLAERFKSLGRAMVYAIAKVPNLLVALVLLVIAFSLASPSVYFFTKFNDIPVARDDLKDLQTPFPEDFSLNTPLESQADIADPQFPSPYANLYLNITQIKHVTPTKATLTGSLDLFVSPELFDAVCDQAAPATKTDKQRCDVGSPITFKANDGSMKLKPQYESENLVLTVSSQDGFFSQIQPLRQFYPNGSDPVELPITLTLETQASAYPDDWYQFQSVPLVTIEFSSLSLFEEPLASHEHLYSLPALVSATLDTSLDNMSIAFASGGWVYRYNGREQSLDILIQRNFSSKALTYLALAFVPFALLLLFSHAIITQAQKGKELITNSSLNILIMILTFIAIRQVFVPSDIQGVLTRIDYLSMIFGTVLLGVIFFTYAIALMFPIINSIFGRKKSIL